MPVAAGNTRLRVKLATAHGHRNDRNGKAMRRVKAIGRFGGLAIGLAVGAALAASPGIASADPFDIDISFDGIDIFHTPGHTAQAFSGTNDFAIAIGTHSIAAAGDANPGQFDTAFADGTNSSAFSGDGNFDSAFANGDNSVAGAGGDTPTLLGNGDFASAFGANTYASAGDFGLPSNNDVALAFDPFGSHQDQVFAGNGDFLWASVVGDASVAHAGFDSNFDLAEVFGNGLTSTTATGANFLTDILTGAPF